MDNYSTISITFTTDLPLGSVVSFSGSTTNGSLNSNYIETFVPIRIGFFQVTTPLTFTAVAGEQTAINYMTAMLVDGFSIGATITRVANTVTIKRLNVNWASAGIGFNFALTPALGLGPTFSNPVSVIFDIDNNVDETPIANEQLDPLPIDDLMIEIIDTYNNTNILILEHTQIKSPKLSFNGGDDLFENIVSSKLTFNMLVADGSDGKFAHLFTGDENRYLVKLSTINSVNVKNLLWQGFLLPDEQKEPWKIGVFFVDFTAVDKLGSLKGSYLKPWLYKNRVPVGQLLAYCLQATNLNQPIIVAPSLIPQYGSYKFFDINVPLNQYYNNGKGTDAYTILTDFLKNNGLTITNYRGFWFIVGLSRKKDEVLTGCFQYDADGNFINYIDVNRISQPFFFKESVLVTSNPPFKQISCNFNLIGLNDGYSENVVRRTFFSTLFVSNAMIYAATPYQQIYKTGYFKLWQRFGISGNYINLNENSDRFFIQINFLANISEAIALTNYWKCPEQPFVKAGIEYDFEIESTFVIHSLDGDLGDQLNAGVWDSIFAYQMFINNTEVYAKRPSVTMNEHTRSFTGSGTGAQIKYSLKTKIIFNQSGRIDFRMLLPIWVTTPDNYVVNFSLDKLSLSSTSSEATSSDNSISVIGIRDINYTKEMELDVKFLSDADETITNNYGLGAPLNSSYENTLTRTPETDFIGHHYFGSMNQFDKLITLSTFSITLSQFTDLFTNNFSDNIFLVKPSGEEVSFRSWYANLNNNVARMGFLKDYDDGVVIPKNYKKYPLTVDSEGDFKYFIIRYPLEFSGARQFWFINGVADADTFLKQLVKMYHYVTHRIAYSIEGTAFGLVFPLDLIEFNYFGQPRSFIPTTLELDLTDGSTSVKASEAIWQEVTDITFE